MSWSFPIARLFGSQIRIHVTFLLLLAWIGISHYQQGGAPAAFEGVAFILALFACVIAHEFGHALAARRYGIRTPDITLLPIGGLARLERMPEKSGQEIVVALAGPAVNVVIAVVLFLIMNARFDMDALQRLDNPALGFMARLFSVNIFLVLFNLIPAFPMDGGRVLRGLLATRLGPVRATDISSTIGQAFAVLFILFGFFSNNFLLAIVGFFVFLGASGEAQLVRQREQMRGLSVSDVMGTKGRTETVTPYHNFGQVLDSVIHGYQEDFPVLDEDGNLVGIITRNEIMAAAHSPDRYSTVRDLMKTEFPTISPDADLFTEGNRVLQESGFRALPVIKDGNLVGMLSVDDVGQAALLRDLRKQ